MCKECVGWKGLLNLSIEIVSQAQQWLHYTA